MSLEPSKIDRQGISVISANGNESYAITASNDVGVVIRNNILTTPITTLMNVNGFTTGADNVSFTNIYDLKKATPALRLPATNDILVVNNTLEANDNNTTKTRIANMSAVASVNPQLTLKADTGGAVWEEADLTQNGLTYIDATGSSSTATWSSIIAGGGSIGLGGVLTNSNNAGANSINMNNNDINNLNNVNLSTINGLPPTTIGLNWGSFTGGSAFANLPTNAYVVQNGSDYTSQQYNLLQVYNSSVPNYANYTANEIDLVDVNSSTTTSYSSNNINIQNGTAFTITQQSGQNINLNCGQLVINGTPYSPPTPPPLRWGYYQNSGQSFSASSGTYTNVGVGSSPIQYLSGMTPSGSYTIAIQFNCWVDSADTTSSCYINYNNINGSFTGLYDTGTPCPNTTAVGVYPYGSSTQFTIQDTLIFTAGSGGELALDLYFGTNAGFSGYYKWSLSAQIISP